MPYIKTSGQQGLLITLHRSQAPSVRSRLPQAPGFGPTLASSQRAPGPPSSVWPSHTSPGIFVYAVQSPRAFLQPLICQAA